MFSPPLHTRLHLHRQSRRRALVALLLGSVLARPGGAQDPEVGSGAKPARQDPLASYRLASKEGIAAILPAIQGERRRFTRDLGIAMFAACGDGSNLAQGPWAEALAGMDAELRKYQWPDGSFYDAASKGPRVPEHRQVVGAMGLLECAVTTPGDAAAESRSAAARAVARVASAVREDGAWHRGYSQDQEGDVHTTAWAVMALATASRAGLVEVDPQTVRRACAWLAERVAQAEIGSAEARGDLAHVILAHYFAGIDPRRHEVLGPLVPALVPDDAFDPEGAPWADAESFAWISLAAFQLGGAEWNRWQPVHTQVVDAMLSRSVTDPTPEAQAMRVLGAQAYWRYGNLLRRRR